MARSVGIKRDLRLSKLETYANYYFLNFRGFLGQHGDCYDRFLIRMCEMSESLNIINQVVYKLIKYKFKNKKLSKTPHNLLKYTNINSNNLNCNTQYNSMERVIDHFKF
jgi:NADH:ubiquinone oxidoreductase subunit D